MAGWLLVGLGLAVLVGAVRIPGRVARTLAQGLGVLALATGAITLLRRPGSAWHLPGYGPRRWHSP